jgi:hypothetical protein
MFFRSRFRFLLAGALLAGPTLTLAAPSPDGPPGMAGGAWDYDQARALTEKAEALANRPELAAAVDAACRDPKLHASVLATPEKLLEKAGLPLPEGLGIEVFELSPRTMPFPGWTPFLVEFTNCRTYYRWVCSDEVPPVGEPRKCKFVEEQVCLGFRIRATPWPVGPFTL